MQASPYRDIDLEPRRLRMCARPVSFDELAASENTSEI
jgi:hypothetical protein